jgi:hypothetical protein
MTEEQIRPLCVGCSKRPHEIEEYAVAAEEEDMTPDQYVKEEEGTYNPSNGHFYCTGCYIDADMPLGVAP